jgi:imidazolonepropionase-like amidohydrolase
MKRTLRTLKFLSWNAVAGALLALSPLAAHSQAVPALVPAAGQTIAIRAGNLIDPKNGTVAKNQIILVKDKKIVAKGADVAIPKDAEIVDLSNSWVMPGLMDAHTHVTWGVPRWDKLGYDYLENGTGTRVLIGLRTVQTLLNAGITTVRDVGNDGNYSTVDLRKAIDAGWFLGPTILTAGKIIAPYGGQNPGIPQEMGAYWRFDYIDADGPEQIRSAIRKNIYYGADLIKLVADSNDYHYSLDEIRAAVDEAHHANRAVAVHVFSGEAADNVIKGGVDSLEHGFYLTDDQLRMMKEKGIFLVGTEFPEAHFAAGGVETLGQGSAKELAATVVDRLKRAYKIGVKMGFGTDIVIDLPKETRADMTLDYLAGWRAAGVPNAEILKCMTTNDAELLRIQKDRGAIEPGLYADIVAMPRDPLADIEALRSIDFVMKNGTIVRKPK